MLNLPEYSIHERSEHLDKTVVAAIATIYSDILTPEF
jgi:hypothetical protein